MGVMVSRERDCLGLSPGTTTGTHQDNFMVRHCCDTRLSSSFKTPPFKKLFSPNLTLKHLYFECPLRKSYLCTWIPQPYAITNQRSKSHSTQVRGYHYERGTKK